jgi:hypothetical protein
LQIRASVPQSQSAPPRSSEADIRNQIRRMISQKLAAGVSRIQIYRLRVLGPRGNASAARRRSRSF